MESMKDLQPLSDLEAMQLSGGGFAYDLGCVLGFIVRSAPGPVGQAYAYAVWFYQHS